MDHGNFIPDSFGEIRREPQWAARLKKAHTSRATALPPPHNENARELDSCTSSDALLMNAFCYPGVVSGEIAALLGVEPGTRPSFGVAGAVPKRDGGVDTTEVDMRIAETNVEAKLTEPDFTRKRVSEVNDLYGNVGEVFCDEVLAHDGDDYPSYQLIRNVLAVAARPSARFIVLLDARRPDLLRAWWEVHAAIRSPDLRRRCGLVLWQEIAAAAPAPLRGFLDVKYGLLWSTT